MTKKRKTMPTAAEVGRLRLVVALLLLILGLAVNSSHAEEVFSGDDASKPYTHLQFQNDPNSFQFAVISDHAGGHRRAWRRGD